MFNWAHFCIHNFLFAAGYRPDFLEFFAFQENGGEFYAALQPKGNRNQNRDDYISLTDVTQIKDSDNPRYIIQNWMRNQNTIEFLGVWENLYNANFNRVDFGAFRAQAGLDSFVMAPQKWIESTGAIGIVSKSGRYGGTYAHKEIAFEFASWISVEVKLYLVQEFERLKTGEMKQFGWDIKRNLAKINYRIHTDAIKEHLDPSSTFRKIDVQCLCF